jgi:hypothetical protein
MDGRSAILFTRVIIIGLVNTIQGVPTTPITTVGNVVLPLNFLPTKTPFDPLSNFVVDPISTPLLTTSMVGATNVSTLMVVIPTSND